MRPALVFLPFLGLSAAACSPPQSLAELGGSAYVYITASPARIHAMVAQSPGCPELTAHATLDGIPMKMITAGGLVDRGGWDGEECWSLSFELLEPPVADGPGVLRIWDDSGEIQVEVTNLRAQRSARLVAPSDGRMYVGDEVRYAWSPATDELAGGFQIDGPFGYFDGEGAGHEVTFTAPDSEASFLIGEGPVSMSPWRGQVTAPVTRCDVGKCTAVIEGGAEAGSVDYFRWPREVPHQPEGFLVGLWSLTDGSCYDPSGGCGDVTFPSYLDLRVPGQARAWDCNPETPVQTEEAGLDGARAQIAGEELVYAGGALHGYFRDPAGNRLYVKLERMTGAPPCTE